jgi:hypothetical protein
VQILEITQASIQEPILDLASNHDWGDPREYNIKVNKKGQKLDTEYTVQPSPKSAVPAEAHAAYRESRINLTHSSEAAKPESFLFMPRSSAIRGCLAAFL